MVWQAADETTVIFDLDGTLVDSAPDLAAAMNVVLDANHLPPLPTEDVRHLVGNGAKALIERGFTANGRRAPTEDEMASHITLFLDHYSTHLTDFSVPFPDTKATLEALQAQNIKLAVCTNKREALALPLLRDLELLDFFDSIICRDTLPVYKPDPAPLLECCVRTNRPYGIMVGDTMTDLSAALAASMPCAIATFGYGRFTAADIKKARPFDHFGELPDLVSSLLSSA
jgi:phosphoglycolate phosphatase